MVGHPNTLRDRIGTWDMVPGRPTMRIMLDDRYYIEDNGYGYNFVKLSDRVDKHGVPVPLITKSPSSLEHALRLYARFKAIDEKEEMTLKEYVETINSTYNSLIRATRGE